MAELTDHTFASVYCGLARSHMEQAKSLRNRIEIRGTRLGPEAREMLWAIIHAHEETAAVLLEGVDVGVE